jgi:heptaprenyl diphosphate synthase
MQKITVRKLTIFALLLGIGIILHFLEIYISIPVGGYMIKPGIANVVVLFCMYLCSFQDAAFLALTRVLLSALFEPSITIITICISLGGVVLSLLCMGVVYAIRSQNIVIISIAGAIAHNIGQLIVVLVFIPNKYLLYYVPLLIISGFFGGLITGWIVTLSLPKIQQPVT